MNRLITNNSGNIEHFPINSLFVLVFLLIISFEFMFWSITLEQKKEFLISKTIQIAHQNYKSSKYQRTMTDTSSTLIINKEKEQTENLQSICNECLNTAKSYGFTKEEIINELKNQ